MKTLLLCLCLLSPLSLLAENGTFVLTTKFTRNKKIWGTYKIDRENIVFKRGKKVWRKALRQKSADLIIAKGNINLLREKNSRQERTQITALNLPYAKRKKSFRNKDELIQDQWHQAYGTEIEKHIPHLDLKQGQITYDSLNCAKKLRGVVQCTLVGKLIPKSLKVSASERK